MPKKKYNFLPKVYDDYKAKKGKIKTSNLLMKFWSTYLSKAKIQALGELFEHLHEICSDVDYEAIHDDMYLLYGYPKFVREFYVADLKKIKLSLKSLEKCESIDVFLSCEGRLFGKKPGETLRQVAKNALYNIQIQLTKKIYGVPEIVKGRTKNVWLEIIEFRLIDLFLKSVKIKTDSVNTVAEIVRKLVKLMGYSPLPGEDSGAGIANRYKDYLRLDNPYEDPMGFERD